MNAAGGLASQHGAAGAFFNGVLATVLATPCTAPFLGAALGFAFAQPRGDHRAVLPDRRRRDLPRLTSC